MFIRLEPRLLRLGFDVGGAAEALVVSVMHCGETAERAVQSRAEDVLTVAAVKSDLCGRSTVTCALS